MWRRAGAPAYPHKIFRQAGYINLINFKNLYLKSTENITQMLLTTFCMFLKWYKELKKNIAQLPNKPILITIKAERLILGIFEIANPEYFSFLFLLPCLIAKSPSH
jgi:hypothetical protein